MFPSYFLTDKLVQPYNWYQFSNTKCLKDAALIVGLLSASSVICELPIVKQTYILQNIDVLKLGIVKFVETVDGERLNESIEKKN